MEDHPIGAGDRSVLDLDPNSQLCLDFLTGWARDSGFAGYDRD